jgi:hypothetical protein
MNGTLGGMGWREVVGGRENAVDYMKGIFGSKLGSHGSERWKHAVLRSRVRTDIGGGTV